MGAAQGAGKGLAQIGSTPALLAYEMGQHFGVGIREKGVAFGEKFVLDFLKVLDDAVVDDGNGAVLGEMRVGVAFHGQSVGGPARVPYAGRGQKIGVVRQLGLQCRQLARSLDHMKPARLFEGHARRVIASVFQAMQSFHQQGHGGTMSAVANDSAHMSTPVSGKNIPPLYRGNAPAASTGGRRNHAGSGPRSRKTATMCFFYGS